MKNSTLLLLCGLFLVVSCGKEPDVMPDTPPANGTSADYPRLDFHSARTLAQKATEMLPAPVTRSGRSVRGIDPGNIRYVVSKQTRSGVRDTLLYVFNYENEMGFALIAPARPDDPLLAVTEHGSFDPDAPIDNPGLALFMEMAVSVIAPPFEPSTPPQEPTNPLPLMDTKTVHYSDTIKAERFCPVRWGQEEPYNMFCFKNGKRAYVGCVATAMAQIMAYFKHPAQITLTHQNSTIQPLNWTAINNAHNTYYQDCNCSTHTALAQLMREIGKRVGMEYGAIGGGGSGAYTENTRKVYPSLGYAVGSYIDYSYTTISQSLDKNQLVHIRGQEKGTEAGHSWVVDGYKHIKEKRETWGRTKTTAWRLLFTETAEYKYVHCNWGWDGDSNGYFSDKVFNTRYAPIIDEGCTNYMDISFVGLKVIPYIHPK